MKKILIIYLAIATSPGVFGQQIDTEHPLTKEAYLKKSKNQKVAGTVLIIGGVVLNITATVVSLAQATDDIVRGIGGIINPDIAPRKNDQGVANVLFITGTVAIVSSIPLFIASGKNKRKAKAMSISFKPEKTLQLYQYGLVSGFVPSISLKIHI